MTFKLDYINGLIEIGGALLNLLNARQLLRDRTVHGVHWFPSVCWTLWGYWNVVYYMSLAQWVSCAGGSTVVIVGTINLFLMWRFWPRRMKVKND